MDKIGHMMQGQQSVDSLKVSSLDTKIKNFCSHLTLNFRENAASFMVFVAFWGMIKIVNFFSEPAGISKNILTY